MLGITREVARGLEQKLNGPGGERYRVYVGLRHWHPYIKEAYAELLDDQPVRLIGLCMAPQYSSMSIGAYISKVEEARMALGGDFPVSYVQSWHRHPGLVKAIAENIAAALQKFPAAGRALVPIIFTAHSLPERILQTKDPYPEEVRGTMEGVCELVKPVTARFAFQSQGRSGEKWLGPDVESILEDLHRDGHRQVLIAPIGFISDHVEILYDVDIEFKRLAGSKDMQLERIPMLNASMTLIETDAEIPPVGGRQLWRHLALVVVLGGEREARHEEVRRQRDDGHERELSAQPDEELPHGFAPPSARFAGVYAVSRRTFMNNPG